jgi:Ni,Fe-hydrogenase I large subunit
MLINKDTAQLIFTEREGRESFKAPFEDIEELALTLYATLRKKPEHEFMLMYYRECEHIMLMDLQENFSKKFADAIETIEHYSCQNKEIEREYCTVGIYSIEGSKGMLKHWILHDLKYMQAELDKESYEREQQSNR